MGTLNEDLSAIKEVEDKIVANKVARFAYTDEAYTTNDANGVAEYNVNNDQNIPTADASVLKVNETVLSKGYRAQASSVTRMLLNHFFGRMSYNLNKVNDIVSNLIATLIGHRGTANGFATLDENGRIPYSQLPESAMEYKGQWNAETNTPTLADGTGSKGDFYIVSVGGTQNLGSGNIQFSANDRIIYDGSVWARLSAGAVQTVNNISPTNGNVALTGENIPVSSTDPTLLSAPLTTDRYADSSVTTEKIVNNAVTNAKIADNAVTNAKIVDNAVTTEKIVNNAVTNAKIADNAVTNAKIKEPISVTKGGTGATTAKDAFMNLANGLSEGNIPLDTEYVAYKNTGGTHWGLYTLSTFWEYIKGKISSVLGLTTTNYGGTALNATNAEQAARASTAESANKIVPNYAKTANFTAVTTDTTKYIKIADCAYGQTGTLQVRLVGGYLLDTLVINFDGGNATTPMLCGHYSGNSGYVRSVIAQKGSTYNSNYSIYVKILQRATCSVLVAILKGDCTINITESTTAPTNISEWAVRDGIFGNFIGNVTGNLTGNATNAYSGMVHNCYTASATAAKTVSIPGFTLTQGACIRVVFNNGNSVATPTLKVNDTSVREILCARGKLDTEAIKNSGSVVKSGKGVYSWDSFTVLDLYYDGAHWLVLGDPIVKRFYNSTTELRKNITITGILLESYLY